MMSKIKFCVVLILAFLTSILVLNVNLNYGYLILFILMCSIWFFFNIWKFLRFYLNYLLEWHLNDNKINLDKRIQKPRIIYYVIFSLLSIILFLCFYFFRYEYSELNFSSIFIAFSLCMYFLYFTWSNDFEQKYTSSFKEVILKEENRVYKLTNYNKDQLKVLYINLIENNFIELIDDSLDFRAEDLFAEILFEKKAPENPVFKLNFDNVQTKYFWDLLKKNNMSFTLDEFLKIFCNKNKNATRKTIEPSFSKSTNEPKKKQDIDNCFIF